MEIKKSKFQDSKLVDIRKHIPNPTSLSIIPGYQLALIYPFIETQEILGDVLNRLNWALTFKPAKSFKILVPTHLHLSLKESWATLPVSDYEFNSLQKNPQGLFCQLIDKKAFLSALKIADLLLVWDVSHLQQLEVQDKLNKVLILDPVFYLDTEAENHAQLRYLVASQADREILRERARAAYFDIYQKFEGCNDACLFLTGPSLESGLSRPLPNNSLRIICNSLVKNDSLLDLIQPDILVFADPAFHYGVSKYADTFRGQVIKGLNRFPECICIIPEKYLPQLLGNFPTEMSERLIGMPEKIVGDFNFPDAERFWVKATDNILTHLMLPIASSLSPIIHIFGADGRQKQDAGYWQHNPSSQFSGLIRTVYQTHPSFERDRDIEAYYANHCETVEKLIQKRERDAGRNYISETPSFIPALSKRFFWHA